MGAQPPVCDFGWQAPDFDLAATRGKRYDLANASGPKGLLVMFICNHCPYVKAIRERMIRFNRDLELQYHRRLDASKTAPVANARRDLFEAMKAVAETGRGSAEQIASVGRSIKWKR